ncbi:MAG TPA: D-aminoacyl-tRNA deacylase [Candidatus Sulfotelmatobacter sp.]|nr:D-aminoacyl-tRNA deacylase [Candidatus Sulfotelmatobacter sp.]
MRAVVQRVSRGKVTVEGEVTGQIERGYVVLLGVAREDTPEAADYMAEKVAGLRVFEDEQGKMNRSILEAGGAVLAISQFTLYGDVRRGRRPGFDRAGRPELAEPLYERFCEKLRGYGLRVETGRFQTHMEVELVNDGPVTILIDSEKGF